MMENKVFSTRVKEKPVELRPRERLERGSAKSLSDTELIAILLGTGTSGHDVMALADEILCQSGGIEGLLQLNMRSLCDFKGVGKGKAATLLAAIEIGRRLMRTGRREQQQITDSLAASQLIRGNLRTSEQESFHVIYLDSKNRPLEVRELFVGTVNGTSIHLRDIFREAVRQNAVSIIVGHNHPSGDVTPSKEDRILTRQIQDAAALLGVKLLDHIIVGEEFGTDYLSFCDKGYLHEA
ncbi:MAG: DNA repair protein RadC [Peptococcaceae bacterium]|nr:DNA repair protein RadC [Peptococcaceae bacterium]